MLQRGHAPDLLEIRALSQANHSGGTRIETARHQPGALQEESGIQGLGIHKVLTYVVKIGPF